MPSAWNRPNNAMGTKKAPSPAKTQGISGLMPTPRPAAPLKTGTPGLGSARFNLRKKGK